LSWLSFANVCCLYKLAGMLSLVVNIVFSRIVASCRIWNAIKVVWPSCFLLSL
jgi:hypothetical protein